MNSINLTPAKTHDNSIIQTYAHDDCAAFAEALMYYIRDCENQSLEARLLIAGNNLGNHYYVEVKDLNSNQSPVFCDAYGIYSDQNDILSRYNFNSSDVEEVIDWEDDRHLINLVEKSYAWKALPEDDYRCEDFHHIMQEVINQWCQSLVPDADNNLSM